MGEKLLLLGYRQGGLRAAKKLGIKVDLACLDNEAPAQSSAERIFKCANEEDLLELILDSAGSGLTSYRAVLALTEKFVPLAGKLRELWGLSGMGEEAAIACHFKPRMKEVANRGNIQTSQYLVIKSDTSVEDIIGSWGWPLVVKEASLSGSRGLSICQNRSELLEAWRPGKLVEAFIRGREMSIESFLWRGQIYLTNFTSYYRHLEMNIIPANLPSDTARVLLEFNRQVLEVFKVWSGMTHLELFLTESGPVFGELAIRPPGGHILELIKESYGFDPWLAWLESELDERPRVHAWQGLYSGCWILHPGAGRVKEIFGRDELSLVPGLRKFRLKVEKGQKVIPRIGSGIEVGYGIFVGDTYEQLVETLDRARSIMKIQME